MDLFVAWSSTAGQLPRQLSSIDDVQRWLTTLTEATSTQQLESVRAAVNLLTKPEFKRDDARALCKIWPVKQDRGKQRPLEQVVRELKEHVIKVSNRECRRRAIAGSVAVQREAQKLAASNAGSGAADANDSSQVASAGSVAVQHGAQTKTDSEAESGAADAKDSSQVPNAGSVAVQHPMASSVGSLSASQSSDAPRITKTDKNYPSSKHPNVPGKARPPFKVGMQPTPPSCPPRKKDSDLVVDPHLVVIPDAADKVVNAPRLVRPPAKRKADEVAAVDAHKPAKKKVHDDKPLPPWRLLPWHRD